MGANVLEIAERLLIVHNMLNITTVESLHVRQVSMLSIHLYSQYRPVELFELGALSDIFPLQFHIVDVLVIEYTIHLNHYCI